MLTTTTWWDEGETFMTYHMDEGNLYFENMEGKAIAVLKSEEGVTFQYVKPSEHQEYYDQNRNEILEQKRNYRRELKELVVVRLGGRCRNCGYDKLGALDVKGGSPRGQKGYTAYYNQILRIVEITNEHSYYLLCANCQRLEEEK